MALTPTGTDLSTRRGYPYDTTRIQDGRFRLECRIQPKSQESARRPTGASVNAREVCVPGPSFLSKSFDGSFSVVCCVKFSSDGKYLATGCNKTAQIYDTKTGAKIR